MTDNDLIPAWEWYSQKSAELGLPPRCPFASVKRCPRYYESLSLLGLAGSTKIDQEEDERLKHFWERSDLWPPIREYRPAILGDSNFSNFCPEIIYDRFGYFSSHLRDYGDEIDRDFAHRKLKNLNISGEHWRWRWGSIRAMHYSECSLYSPLREGGGFREGSGPQFKLGFPGVSIQFKLSWHDLRYCIARQWSSLMGFFRSGDKRLAP